MEHIFVKTHLMFIVEAMGGGVRRHVIDLIRHLEEDCFELSLVYGAGRADHAFFTAIGPLRHKIHVYPSENLVREIAPKKELAAYRELVALMRREKPDVVHCHSSKAGVLGRLAARRAGVPVVLYTPHAYAFQSLEFSEAKKRLFIAIERWMGRHATTAIIHVSEGERSYAARHRLAKPERLLTVYNGIPDTPLPQRAALRRELGLPEDATVVGVAARLNKQKDPLTFARIAKQALQARPELYFVYIGDGPLLGEMKDFVAAHGLRERVLLPGYRDDAEYVVAAFDAYLLTSLYEGFPYSLLEALRAGVPVVATRVVGNDEIVLPGQNGGLFPPGDAQEGSRQLLRVLEAGYTATAVRETYLSRFSLQKMVSALQQLYMQEATETIGISRVKE